jgi:hypothetical protein
LLLAQVDVDLDSSILHSPPSLRRQACTTTLSFFSIEMGLTNFFLSGLAWNGDLPDLSLPSSWGYRLEPSA